MRVGQGWDSHRLVENRQLVLGGIIIPSEKGEDGHSDGDVLIHAIIDGLLGAAGLQDIGSHFPPGDSQFKDISSVKLLEKTLTMITKSGWTIENIDSTVILQSPKLRPHISGIRTNLADILKITPDRINIKAKTAEGLGPVGEGWSIEAQAIVLLIKKAAV